MSPRLRQAVGPVVFAGLGLIAVGGAGVQAHQAVAHTQAARRAVASTAGWAHAAPQLEAAMARWDPPRASEPAIPALWAAQRLQQAVAQAGVQVVILEPAASDARPLLNTTVMGSSPAIATFLQILPQWLPGLTLERLELVAQDRGLECRLELAASPSPRGAS